MPAKSCLELTDPAIYNGKQQLTSGTGRQTEENE